MVYEGLEFVCDVSGGFPGFGAIEQHGFNVGVEDLKLRLEGDVFTFLNFV